MISSQHTKLTWVWYPNSQYYTAHRAQDMGRLCKNRKVYLLKDLAKRNSTQIHTLHLQNFWHKLAMNGSIQFATFWMCHHLSICTRRLSAAAWQNGNLLKPQSWGKGAFEVHTWKMKPIWFSRSGILKRTTAGTEAKAMLGSALRKAGWKRAER